MAELQHLSYSSVSLYSQCPRSWSFRYRECVPVATAPALAFGSAWHATIEDLIRRHQHQGVAQPPEAIWRQHWAAASEQEIDWSGGQTPEQMSNEGLRILSQDGCLQAIQELRPLIENGEPVLEKRIELRVPGVPIPVLGFIDMVGDDGCLYDFKTSSKAWTQDKADSEMQPSYYLAAMKQNGHRNTSYRFRYLVFTKARTPQVQVFETLRTASDLFWLLGMVKEVWKGIEREVFPPNPGAWLCSPRWCAYWGFCRGG